MSKINLQGNLRRAISQAIRSMNRWIAAGRFVQSRLPGRAPAPVSERPLPGSRARLAATHRTAGPRGASARGHSMGLREDRRTKAITFIDLEPESRMMSVDECNSPG